jgi:uncharacterized membrane protein YesL
MNKYFSEIMKRGLIGIMIGLCIGYTFVVIMTLSNGSYTFDGKNLMQNYMYAILVGFYMASVTVVFDVEEWSLLKQTLIHSLLNCPYIIVAFVIGWAPTSIFLRGVFVLIYIAIYAVIWLCFKYYWTRKAKELDNDLRRLKTDY